MMSPLHRVWSWTWPARLLLVIALAQACGGDSSKSTGPGRPTQLVITLAGPKNAELRGDCTGGIVRATRPGFATQTATFGRDGIATLFLVPGPWDISVEVNCGGRIFTATQPVNVSGGRVEPPPFQLAVNRAPSGGASCASPVNVGAGSLCQCGLSDPDGDPVQYSWGATGGDVSSQSGPSIVFSSSTPGTFDVTCTASDDRGGVQTATATVVVQPGLGTLVVSLDPSACCDIDLTTFSGPGPITSITALDPGESQTRTGVTAGTYGVSYFCFGAPPDPPDFTDTFTIAPGQTTTVSAPACD